MKELRFGTRTLTTGFSYLMRNQTSTAGQIRRGLTLVTPRTSTPFSRVRLRQTSITFINVLATGALVRHINLSGIPPSQLHPVGPFLIKGVILSQRLVLTQLTRRRRVINRHKATRAKVLILHRRRRNLDLHTSNLDL